MFLVRRVYRGRHRGSSLAIFAAFLVTLVALIGIVLFTSVQALLHHELQQASSAAAKAGAAYYYSGVSVNNRALRDPATAAQVAENTFNNLAANSSILRGFQATLSGSRVTTDASQDSVTVESRVLFGTPLLAPIGINNVELTTRESARSVKMLVVDAPSATPPLVIKPGQSKLIDLQFPITDTPGIEIAIHQNPDNADEQGYIVEACNSNRCHDLDANGLLVNGTDSAAVVRNGQRIISGDASLVFKSSGVSKATKLRITNANMNAYSIKPVVIDGISVYGYASACVTATNCPIPSGFKPAN